MEREKFSSRLGFILISAGCAIGLGNVWRFPYITGQYGGAAFVLIYLLFLVILGLPVIVMEFAVGRASQRSVALSFDRLEPKGTKWHLFKYPAMAGNYLLMMFYTTIGGWMAYYVLKMARGDFENMDAAGVEGEFGAMLGNPALMTGLMVLVVVLGFVICAAGLQKGVEKITKIMMISLLVLMLALVINSLMLEGGREGLEFYLRPDFGKLMEAGLGEAVFAALGQAFFTLSIGMGAIAIFGSYIGREQRLTGEAVNVMVLDTIVAFMAGLIIFPACFAYDIQPDAGPNLLFITLPHVFQAMPGGRLWGTLFFIFMFFAAISTIVAVFQDLISFATDLTGCSVKKAAVRSCLAICLLSIPCVLGFNLWSGFQPLGPGSTVLDLEDFLVSNNVLPLGSLVYVAFCTSRYGWGWDRFLEEANTGKGLAFPRAVRIYIKWVLPAIILFIFLQGYVAKFL
ncbi:MAG: sodium-dependent transporter [Lachnospiraceae bacterium]|nr:sodium-dependent transporter [Lachnospiraceae bacterium]MCI9132906.1 sodium-dependent transporter [Lachnospiraceae bacterium]